MMTACIKYLNFGGRHKEGECKACDKEHYNNELGLELAKKFGDNYTYGKIITVLKEKFISKQEVKKVLDTYNMKIHHPILYKEFRLE